MNASEPLASPGPAMPDRAVGELTAQLIAAAAGLTPDALRGRDRDLRAGRARQIAFYLVHIGLGWPLDRTGRLFSRQRSTISHACRQVEDRRDDAALDRQLGRLEAVLRDAVTLKLDL